MKACWGGAADSFSGLCFFLHPLEESLEGSTKLSKLKNANTLPFIKLLNKYSKSSLF